MPINYILFLVSLVILIGYLAEWIFKRKNIPDIIILITLGFILGPNVLNIINPESLGTLAPLFTTFTLLFLLFDGALYIDLKSFARGIGSGLFIGASNFLLSAVLISSIFYFFTTDLIVSLMLGFSLGGVSSAFIIPILKQIDVDKKIFSVLTLESALTDVLSIILAITMMEFVGRHSMANPDAIPAANSAVSFFRAISKQSTIKLISSWELPCCQRA